ncbi:hypothetical protein KM043_003179 [Ampulex compressa]|nr:hypothetical protein KM043_003179 [Ampulex compressa]
MSGPAVLSVALTATLFLSSLAFPQDDRIVFDGPTDRPITTQSSGVAREITTQSASTARQGTTPSVEDFNACMSRCPVTTEYNPVCGTDNVNYDNPGGLGCAQKCGLDISLNYYGRCSSGNARG